MRKIIFFILFCAFGHVNAQEYTVLGTVTDSINHVFLGGTYIIIKSDRDSSEKYFTTTQANGFFEIKGLNPGTYELTASFSGYQSYQQKLQLSNTITNLENIYLNPETITIEQVKIIRNPGGVSLKEDTVQYSAKSFKTNPDASAEDLVKKMPGITVENGAVKAQGEDVKKVLVDGKVFFGDDANIALKNISADMIDKVEIFDQLSDQAQFTGFDDGQSSKTINIVTKNDMKNGTFGRAYAGYGTNNSYQAGGSANFFNKDRRISLLGLSNNINQQNFSMQDILSATGATQSASGRIGRNSPANNFLAGSQPGITSVNSFGLNYSDQWGKKIKVSGSYFFNGSNNVNDQTLSRQFFSTGDTNTYYDEVGAYDNKSFNHRMNFRLEYAIDSMNSFVLTPNISFQNGNIDNQISGKNSLMQSVLLTQSQSNYSGNSNGYKISNDALFRHKFSKKGRTISLNFRTDWNSKSANNNLNAINNYYVNNENDTLNQLTTQFSPNETYTANLNYTEPSGKSGQILLNYKTAYSLNTSSVQTNKFDNVLQSYSLLDSSLSSTLQSNYITQQPGVGYRIASKKVTAAIGGDYQRIDMANNQSLPVANQFNKTFENFLPNAMVKIKFSKKSSLRLNYRTQISVPSVNQLQDVWDNSNPLLLSVGNSSLKAPYTNSGSLKYMYNNPANSRNFMVFAMLGNTQNYIANSTQVVTKDTILPEGKELRQGTRYTMPVNLNGYWNARSYFIYGTPWKKIKSNFNSVTALTYSSTPTLVNTLQSFSSAYSMTERLTLSSNISEKIDFSFSSSGNYNIVKNTLQSSLNYNYFSLVSGFKINYTFWKGLVLQSEINHTFYTGLNQQFNLNYFLWNAALAKKLFKNEEGEIKISVFDVLKQNNSVSRTVNDTYVEDLKNVVLQQYFMLTFTYKIKKITPQAPPTGKE